MSTYGGFLFPSNVAFGACGSDSDLLNSKAAACSADEPVFTFRLWEGDMRGLKSGRVGHKPGSVHEDEPNQRGRQQRVDHAEVRERLSPAAIAHWPVAARQLLDAGVLSAVDACSLASYCEAFARWCAAGEQVAKMLIEFGVRSGKQAQKQTGATQVGNQSAEVAAERRQDAWRRAPNSIMRRQDVEREIGLSRTTIYNRMKEGTFPAAVRLGARSVGWRVADIEAFLANPSAYRAPSKGT